MTSNPTNQAGEGMFLPPSDYIPGMEMPAWQMFVPLRPQARAIHTFLWAHLDRNSGNMIANPAMATIATWLGFKKTDAVRPYVDELIQAGLVEKVSVYLIKGTGEPTLDRYDEKGRKREQSSNSYRLQWAPPQRRLYPGPLDIKEYYSPKRIEDRLATEKAVATGGETPAPHERAVGTPHTRGTPTPHTRGTSNQQNPSAIGTPQTRGGGVPHTQGAPTPHAGGGGTPHTGGRVIGWLENQPTTHARATTSTLIEHGSGVVGWMESPSQEEATPAGIDPASVPPPNGHRTTKDGSTPSGSKRGSGRPPKQQTEEAPGAEPTSATNPEPAPVPEELTQEERRAYFRNERARLLLVRLRQEVPEWNPNQSEVIAAIVSAYADRWTDDKLTEHLLASFAGTQNRAATLTARVRRLNGKGSTSGPRQPSTSARSPQQRQQQDQQDRAFLDQLGI